MPEEKVPARPEGEEGDPGMTARWKMALLPLGRMVLAVLMVGGAVAVAQVVVKMLKGVLTFGGLVPAVYYLAYLIVSVLVAYVVYRAYVRLIEKRAVPELSADGAPREFGIGTLVGLGLVFVIVGLLWLLGCYHVTGVGVWTAVFVVLANEGAGAFVEELLLRGVVFRISEERLGTWVALGISVLIFALLHLAGANATVTSVVVVGIEGGVLLSAAQDYLFGLGRSADGLVRAQLTGPGFLSGGGAGIEGSILALILCLLVSAYLLVRSARKGNIVRPSFGSGREKADPAS
jgi:membrane protease YdiL (CAAX protease family)